MAKPEKTVFISYRRSLSAGTARALRQALTQRGYDVFMDVESIDSGDFDEIITQQIAARMHFLLVLEPGSLDRIAKPGDWLRREIKRAIRYERNIVPVIYEGFAFDDLDVPLEGKLKRLPSYNGVNIYHDYYEEGINKLVERFLKPQTGIELHPIVQPEQEIPFYRRWGWWAVALLTLILYTAIGWIAGWGVERLVDGLNWPAAAPGPAWLLPATGLLWGVLLVASAAIMAGDEVDAAEQYVAFGAALVGPYGSMFDRYVPPGFLGGLLCALPLNLLLTYGAALLLPAGIEWLSVQSRALLGVALPALAPATLFWSAYGLLLLWGVVGYVRGALEDWV